MATPFDNRLLLIHWIARTLRPTRDTFGNIDPRAPELGFSIRDFCHWARRTFPNLNGLSVKTLHGVVWQGAGGSDDPRDIRGLIPLAAIRRRGKVRAVGLDEQVIHRDGSSRFPKVPRFRKRNDARERDVKPEVKAGAHKRQVACEAMQHAAQVAAAFLLQNRDRVGIRFARVNHHRQLQLTRQPDLRAKHLLLHITRREIVVVVETDFANRAA